MVLLFFEALLSRTTCTYNCLHTWEGSGTNTKGATLPLSLAFVVLPAPLFLSTPSDFRSCVSASTRSGLRAVWQTTEKLSVPRGNDHLPAAPSDSTAAAYGEFRVRVCSSQIISWTNEWFKNPTPLNTTAIFPQQPPLAASFMSILAHLHYGRKGCLRKVTKSWGMEEAGRNTF